MSIKRTIILSDDINKSTRAILNLQCEKTKTLGEIRLFGAEISPKLAIGIKNGEKPVIKIPLVMEGNSALFSVDEIIDYESKIFCALVDVFDTQNPKVVISGCGYGGDKVNDVVEIAFLNKEKINQEDMYEIDEDVSEVVEKTLEEDEEFEDCSKCVNCKYRKCFYDEESKVETTTELKQEKEIDTKNFYEDIKPQIEDLFKNHQEDVVLENLIPNSKWVKVELDDGMGHYVLGLIYEDGNINYIAYGLPANDNKKPPEDLKEYAQWLPLNIEESNGKGYWLVYQSAKSGESVLINVI